MIKTEIVEISTSLPIYPGSHSGILVKLSDSNLERRIEVVVTVYMPTKEVEKIIKARDMIDAAVMEFEREEERGCCCEGTKNQTNL